MAMNARATSAPIRRRRLAKLHILEFLLGALILFVKLGPISHMLQLQDGFVLYESSGRSLPGGRSADASPQQRDTIAGL
jgi:hypothetical protein